MILYSAAAKIKEALSMEYFIPACPGRKINIKRGQRLTITDLEGGQVADFFAVSAEDNGEFLSPAVTLDCHGSLKLNAGDALYTNLYRPMFRILSDDVGTHDLLFPSCRPEMYEFFYQNGTGTRTALTTSTERRGNAFSSSAR